MAIDLATLLQGVPGIANAPAPPVGWEKMIDPSVLQPAQGPQLAPDVRPPSNTSSVSQDIQGTEDMGSSALEKFQHKGIFGVKGTLRDILGILGDSLTGDMLYSKNRRQEKFGDILAGGYQNNEEENFINNPLLAIQRLGEEGFGQEAVALYQDYVKNQAAKAAQAQAAAQLGRQELRDTQLAKQGDVRADKDLQEILGRTYASIKDPAVLAQFNEWVGKKIQELPETSILRGMPLPRNVDEAGRYGIQPYQQERLEDFDRGLGIQQQNANTNAATSRPRADTPVELFERYSRIPSDKRTPEQQAFITKYISTGQRGRGRRTGGEATSSGGAPSAPPRKKGDAYRTSDGRIWRSPDGKSWQ